MEKYISASYNNVGVSNELVDVEILFSIEYFSDCASLNEARHKLDKSLVILSEDAKTFIVDELNREIEKNYTNSKRDVLLFEKQNEKNLMPPLWAIIVMILLGWNEIMALIKSPLYLLIFMIVVSIVFIMIKSENYLPLRLIKEMIKTQ